MKPTVKHGPLHKSELDFSYSISDFIWLPQKVSKGLINHLSQKVSYTSMMIYLFVNVFSPNELIGNFKICDNSIINFETIGLWFGFSNTSHVVCADRFRKAVVNKVKIDISISMKQKYSKKKRKLNMKMNPFKLWIG